MVCKIIIGVLLLILIVVGKLLYDLLGGSWR